MKREIHVFFTALMFYTRIPCPKWVDHDPAYLNQSIRYFPLIGWIVGGISGLAFFVISVYFSVPVAIIVSLVVSVLLTGAFHEDGFADTCDAFGGGWTRQKILDIMKDSRLGTYGVMGLILLMTLKMALLYEFSNVHESTVLSVSLFFISVHAVSRFTASTFVFTHEYARDSNDSKAKPVAEQTSFINLQVGLIWTIVPVVFLAYVVNNYWTILIFVPAYLTKYFLARYFRKWIGGYTGDCLGATQQVSEVFSYLYLIVLWKFV